MSLQKVTNHKYYGVITSRDKSSWKFFKLKTEYVNPLYARTPKGNDAMVPTSSMSEFDIPESWSEYPRAQRICGWNTVII